MFSMYRSISIVLTVTTFYVCATRKVQNWYNLKLPFAINPLSGFYDQPRTVAEAEHAGWAKVSGSDDCKCVNNGS